MTYLRARQVRFGKAPDKDDRATDRADNRFYVGPMHASNRCDHDAVGPQASAPLGCSSTGQKEAGLLDRGPMGPGSSLACAVTADQERGQLGRPGRLRTTAPVSRLSRHGAGWRDLSRASRRSSGGRRGADACGDSGRQSCGTGETRRALLCAVPLLHLVDTRGAHRAAVSPASIAVRCRVVTSIPAERFHHLNESMMVISPTSMTSTISIKARR